MNIFLGYYELLLFISLFDEHSNSSMFIQFLQRVFSIDTVVKPLPPAMAYNVSRNLSFFTRIFTQFFGEFLFVKKVLVAKRLNINIHELYALYQGFPEFPCFALRVEMHCYLGNVVQTFHIA